MNDLDLIAALRPDVPLAGADELARARDRLTLTLAAEASGQDLAHVRETGRRIRESGPGTRESGRRASATGPRARLGRRFALAGAATAAAAAGIAITLALGSSVPSTRIASGGQRPRSGRSAPGPRQAQSRVTLPATLTAAQFLADGVAALRHRHFTAPLPDQYVYAETEGPNGTSKYQIWQSVDGSHAGLVEPVGSTAVQISPCTVAQARAAKCSLEAGYLPQLPTSGSALLAYLVKIGYATTAPSPKGIPNWAANDLGKNVASLLQDEYLSPAQQAGLYQLMAHTSGFKLVRHAVDALGRSGVGIAWRYEGLTTVLVLNPGTYMFLGISNISRGHLVPGWALVTKQVVDSLPAYQAGPAPRAAASAAEAKCKAMGLSPAKCRKLIIAKLGTRG
jgi:hypothetical protein